MRHVPPLDGTESADREIRKPVVADRVRLLQEFVCGLKAANQRLKVWGTVTLQRGNIPMDLREACRFIRERLGISAVNFKSVTGARNTLEHDPPYRLSEDELNGLMGFLQHDLLPSEEGNQLAYLRDCFMQRVFDVKDAAQGAPLRSFYRRFELQCFTPFLFSLIDSERKLIRTIRGSYHVGNAPVTVSPTTFSHRFITSSGTTLWHWKLRLRP